MNIFFIGKINDYKKINITCPELDCSQCEIKTITETKTEIKKVYVCSDLREVNSINDCKTTEQKEIDSSDYDLIITINNAYLTKTIEDSAYYFDKLKSDERYLIIDFSIYNKGIRDEYTTNTNYFVVEDSDGYSYEFSWDSYLLRKYIGQVNIEQDTKKSLQLAFIVPKNEKNFTLVIQEWGNILSKKSFTVS